MFCKPCFLGSRYEKRNQESEKKQKSFRVKWKNFKFTTFIVSKVSWQKCIKSMEKNSEFWSLSEVKYHWFCEAESLKSLWTRLVQFMWLCCLNYDTWHIVALFLYTYIIIIFSNHHVIQQWSNCHTGSCVEIRIIIWAKRGSDHHAGRTSRQTSQPFQWEVSWHSANQRGLQTKFKSTGIIRVTAGLNGFKSTVEQLHPAGTTQSQPVKCQHYFTYSEIKLRLT